MSATARAIGWAAIAYAILYIGTFVSKTVLSILGLGERASIRWVGTARGLAVVRFGEHHNI